MPKRVAVSTLNASTIDILNTIRENASLEYQSLVPTVTTATDIPRVGEILYGYPALANQFISALVNRIAAVRVKSALFNNPYAELKKGYLNFGETVEEVFVNICKAREFSAEKAAARELKRSIPDVRAAFHAVSYDVQFPVTIQDEDLRLAFQSMEGVQDLIAKIVDSVYRAAEYQEYLLFKYLIIKAVSHGKMKPVAFDATSASIAAETFRAVSNKLTFMSKDYNASGVTTVSPRDDQFIFMDAAYNAKVDVNVLATSFHMEKAEFMGHLKLIDDFTTFDNEQFANIVAGSDQIEEVTSTELALMADVKAVIVDREWFQIYDVLSKFTEQYVASGMYWNYFYNVRKIVSSSPFSNAVVLVDDGATVSLPSTLTLTVKSKDTSAVATVLTCDVDAGSATLQPNDAQFIQTQAAVQNGIAVHPYGAIVIPVTDPAVTYVPYVMLGGKQYYQAVVDPATPTALGASTSVGATITLTKES